MTIGAEPRTRRERVEDKERAILSAASAEFMEHGYEGARMANIARRAGIAEGTIYIYFKTKDDLMRAIVSDFWDDLTVNAQTAVKGIEESLDALRALASFHMACLINRFDVIALTQTLRAADTANSDSREEMKAYVAVFDEIFRRAKDRGLFVTDVPLWVARDVFYGTMEYSARTMLLRGEDNSDLVVDNLIATFVARFGALNGTDNNDASQESGTHFLERLEAVTTRLEAAARS